MEWFDVIVSVPLRNFLIILYNGLFHNLGLAIIALTIVVRLVLLYPTIRQLQASRNIAVKNRDLQPRIQALKAKYAQDKRKLAEETMKLYKGAGVNPLGCLSTPMLLPMLIQIPVWFGLYRAIMLSLAPDLAMSPQFLWLNLAQRDPHFILPVLVMIVMWLSQEVVRIPTGDAQQDQMQSMMRFAMPIMFGVLCIGFPSGLSLFWVVSIIIQLLTEYPMYGWRGRKVLTPLPGVPTMSDVGPDVNVDVNVKGKGDVSRHRKPPAPAKNIPDAKDPGRHVKREEKEKKDGAFGNKGKDGGGGSGKGSGTTRPRS